MRKKVFLIGTGPSLKNIDVSKLKSFDTLTYNRAYLAFDEWGFDPTYYVAIDSNDNRSMYKDINKLASESKIQKMFLVQTSDNDLHRPEDFQDGEQVKDYEMYVQSEKIIRIVNDHSNSSFDGLEIHYDKQGAVINAAIEPNAGFFSLKMMYNAGYRDFYLLGHDVRYKVDADSTSHITVRGGQWTSSANADVNHFRPDYCGKGMTFGSPNEDMILGLWRSFIPFAESYDINVTSCSPISRLNEFVKYKNFEEVMDEINGSN
jgi:hypothetical protein